LSVRKPTKFLKSLYKCYERFERFEEYHRFIRCQAIIEKKSKKVELSEFEWIFNVPRQRAGGIDSDFGEMRGDK